MTEYVMNYHLIESVDELIEHLKKAKDAGIFSWDYETAPTRNYRDILTFRTKTESTAYYKDKKTLRKPATIPQYANICTISFCYNEEDAYIVPVRHKVAPEFNLEPEDVFNALNFYIFSDPTIIKIAYNLIFESKMTMTEGYLLAPNCADPMHMGIRWYEQNKPHKLDGFKTRGQGLKEKTLEIFDHEMLHFEEVTGGKHFDMLSVLDPNTLRYSGEDALCALWLYYYWKEKLEVMEIGQLCNGIDYGERPYKNYFEYVVDIECNVLRVIGMMEYFGISFGKNYKEVHEMATKEKAQIKEDIEKIGKDRGIDFGIKKSLATKRLKEFMFDELKCPVIERGSTGAPSVSSGNITKMISLIKWNVPDVDMLSDEKKKATCRRELTQGVDRYPNREILLNILQKLQRSAKLKTLIGTQLEGRMGWRNIEDGKIHAKYHIYIDTGRFGSRDPNGQNISKNKGKVDPLSVRNIYHPEEGYILACLDYQAQEVRVGGVIYKEPMIIDSVNDGADIHTVTANTVYKKDYDPYTEKAPKEIRDPAKTTIFQAFYGGSKWSVYNKLASYGIYKTMEECDMLIKGLYKIYPNMIPFQKSMENFVYDNGYTETMLGFRRYFGKLGDLDNKEYKSILRKAYNMPIQGTSADMTKNSLNLIYNWMQTTDEFTLEDVRIVGTIHDEIVFEIKKMEPKRLRKLIKILQGFMETPIMPMPLDQLAEADIVDPQNIYGIPEKFASEVCHGWGEKVDYNKWIEYVDPDEGDDEIEVF